MQNEKTSDLNDDEKIKIIVKITLFYCSIK